MVCGCGIGEDLEKERPVMILEYIILASLAVWGVVATTLVVHRDGLRRTPAATY